jgi:hypothetical protein
MAMTLCVDVGWKTLENGEEVYVIQLQAEQTQQMIKDKIPVTCGIPEGVRSVRVQFGNEVLMEARVNPPATETQPSSPESPPPETQPPDTQPAAPPGDPPTETPAPPGPLPGTESTTPEIVTTSLDTPVNPIVPPDTPPAQKEDPPTTPKANEKPTETETGDSYLTTAIVSWIVSAALFGLLLYLGWIHLDTRRRYQALLDKTLSTRSGDLLPLSQHVETTPHDPIEPLPPAGPSETKPEVPEIPAPIPMPEPVEPASPSEEPPETSTSIESEEEEWSEDLEPESDEDDEAWGEYDEEEEEPEEEAEENEEEDDADFSNLMDATERLLQNTNLAIAEASEAERRRLAAEEGLEEDEDQPETVYGLPDTAGGEPIEDDDESEEEKGI